MDEPVEVSLETWEKHKPAPMQLRQEDIDYIHELLSKVGEKCAEIGTSFNASFVTKIDALGASQLQSRIGITMGTLTPEIWSAMFLQTGGLDNLLNNMEALLDAADSRYENLRKLSIVLPSTSIILP